MSQFKQALHSVVAVICMLASVDVMAVPTTNMLAKHAIRISIAVANQKFTNHVPTAEEVGKVADAMDAYAEAADKDGSLAAGESYVKKHADELVNKSPDSNAIYRSLHRHGWLGSSDDAKKLAAATREDRVKSIKEIRDHGLKTYIHKQAATLRLLASKSTWSFCTDTRGLFLGITAVGALASLGGIDPFGDFLLAVGAVGDFEVWIACD